VEKRKVRDRVVPNVGRAAVLLTWIRERKVKRRPSPARSRTTCSPGTAFIAARIGQRRGDREWSEFCLTRWLVALTVAIGGIGVGGIAQSGSVE
jgi:hypothetical protein